MKQNPHDRQSTRLQNYDYGQPGLYFVTICVHGKECALGSVHGQKMVLSPEGEIASQCWGWLPGKFPFISIDIFCVMPNHTHAIIQIHCRGALQSAPTLYKKPIGRLIGAYKTHSTIQINRLRNTAGVRFWQRNFYDHIIRDERSLNRIREYILSNPAEWENDHENLLDQ